MQEKGGAVVAKVNLQMLGAKEATGGKVSEIRERVRLERLYRC